MGAAMHVAGSGGLWWKKLGRDSPGHHPLEGGPGCGRVEGSRGDLPRQVDDRAGKSHLLVLGGSLQDRPSASEEHVRTPLVGFLFCHRMTRPFVWVVGFFTTKNLTQKSLVEKKFRVT